MKENYETENGEQTAIIKEDPGTDPKRGLS